MMSYKNQNKKHKQTPENAQYKIEIIFKNVENVAVALHLQATSK